jgi:hypothetical protein
MEDNNMIELITTLIKEHGDIMAENSESWSRARYLQETIDLILDAIEKNASRRYDGEIRLYAPDKIAEILKYRHPDEYRNMVRAAENRLKREENEDPGDVDAS